MLRIVVFVALVVIVFVIAVSFVNAIVLVVSRQSFFYIQTRRIYLSAICAYNLQTNFVEYSLFDISKIPEFSRNAFDIEEIYFSPVSVLNSLGTEVTLHERFCIKALYCITMPVDFAIGI